MPCIAIDAADDPRISAFLDLPQKQTSRRAEHFVVEGRWLVDRLLDSDIQVCSLLCLDQLAEEFAEIANQLPVYSARNSLMDQIVGFDFHRGVLACGLRPPALRLTDLVPDKQTTSLYAVCAGICDPANLGGIIRNCAAFGADALLLDDHCADPFSRRVLRVSMGAALRLKIIESADLRQDLLKLSRDWRYEITATVLSDDAVSIEHAQAANRAALVFGNEGYGLSEEWNELCDHRVAIPMQGGVDSLNVAVASGIFLYEFAHRQRSKS